MRNSGSSRDISFKDVYSGKYTYNGFFFFLLKSYYSHFSQYSRFPHIQAICQVTMTGAGMCKQDICIQEIALLQCAFPQAVSVREPKYGYSFAKGGNWKIACADMNTQTHLHAGT